MTSFVKYDIWFLRYPLHAAFHNYHNQRFDTVQWNFKTDCSYMQGDLQENQFPDAGKEQPFEKSQYDPKAFFKVKAF